MKIEMDELEAFLRYDHTDPHRVLGLHESEGGSYCVRAFYPQAQSFSLLGKATGQMVPMKRVDRSDLFECTLPKPIDYQLVANMIGGEMLVYEDPYRFRPTLNSDDLYLFNQGNHHRVYNKLGAHAIVHEGIEGYAFAVWAPNARRVSVVGDFNHWDGRIHPMRRLEVSGIWELFIPNVQAGQMYKFEIYDANHQILLKADPYANYGEHDHEHASILAQPLDDFAWTDQAWLDQRAQQNCKEVPLSIYEIHLDSWRYNDKGQPFSYRELASELVSYLKETGFTHVEFMPVAEHPFSGSWGYQVTGFFAPTSRYGTPQDFQYLVNELHRNHFGVIIDWVPGHFPKDGFGLARFDGTALYEHADPRQGEHQDWGTLIFNYGRNEVRNFLTSNALFWLDKFHVDGLRVDAVASMLYLNYSRKEGEWIPNCYGGKENIEAIELLRTTNDLVHHYYPGVMTIAEESTAFGRVSQPTQVHGLGFDLKWNMGWMHDVLSYCQEDPLFRKYHHDKMTFAMLYQYSENFINVFSHDEIVYGKGSLIQKMGSGFFTDKLSSLRALYAFMWGWPGKKTLFMGDEFAQWDEWDYHKQLDWFLLERPDHKGIQRTLIDLNHLYKTFRFWFKYDMQGLGFSWINPDDSDNSVFSFIRRNPENEETLLFISNFTPIERTKYLCGAPFHGKWQEIFNSDAAIYGGLNRGNGGEVTSVVEPRHRQKHTLELYLPPLCTLIFSYNPH